MKITLSVNEEYYGVEVSPATSLNQVLRETIGLTGTKRGCDTGGCGTCTVLLDNRPVFSCMTPAWRAVDKKILTVEGLAKDGKLVRIQESFMKFSAPQCGYCTSSMLLVGKALLESNPEPTEQQVRDALCGVLCRCTGYLPYIQAILEAAKQIKIA